MDHIGLADLPEELLIMIVKGLDFSSQCSLYNSCARFRHILTMHGVVLQCHMSASLVATANTLKLNFFKDIARNLLVLNMSGVHDLTKTKVLPAFRKLKRLKILDISYTNLIIPDLVAIHEACPTVTDITINYKFGEGSILLTDQALGQYQSLFVHFENVHFVGSLDNLLSNNIVLHVLKDSRIGTLQFSIIELGDPFNGVVRNTYMDCEVPHFSRFAVYFLVNWRIRSEDETPNHFPVMSQIKLEKYEFCIIYTLRQHRHSPFVYATPLFKKFFSEHFNVELQTSDFYEVTVKGNVAFFVWNNETTQFDDKFFQNLYRQLKPYFPFYYKTDADVTCPQNEDWIFIDPRIDKLPTETDKPQEKKRKILMPNVEFDYDNLLKDKHKVQLSLNLPVDQIVSATLPSNGQYFSKITFLSLGGAVKYSKNFFSTLLEKCHNLVTLSVELPVITSGRFAYDILLNLKANRSMKNLRLVVKGINFKPFFELLSNCNTLENIILIDPKQWYHCEVANPTVLVQSCAKLYSVFIEAPFSEKAQTKQLQSFNKLKRRFKRPHLRVVIKRVTDRTCLYGYDPFSAVFKLNSIKPICNNFPNLRYSAGGLR